MIDLVIPKYREAIFDTDKKKALEIIHEALAGGVQAEDIVFKIVVPVVESMMKSVSEEKKYNLAQHFIAAQIAAEVTDEMIPKFKQSPKIIGRIVIGTSVGDLHGLGKRIVIGCLKAMMIDAIDLGLNVPAERFVEEAVNHKAHVIGISSMMVHTARGEKASLGVRKLLREMNLEKKIKIAVGGAPYRFDHNLYNIVQADAWAEDGITAGKVIANLIEEVKNAA
ncbi:MAG: cobalamin-dependent protein [bacterium]